MGREKAVVRRRRSGRSDVRERDDMKLSRCGWFGCGMEEAKGDSSNWAHDGSFFCLFIRRQRGQVRRLGRLRLRYTTDHRRLERSNRRISFPTTQLPSPRPPPNSVQMENYKKLEKVGEGQSRFSLLPGARWIGWGRTSDHVLHSMIR